MTGRRFGLVLTLAALPLVALGPARPATADGERPAVRFSHEAHAGKGVAIDACDACHALGADGRAAPPTSKSPHQPCAASGCHEDQFFARKPTVCAVCHDGVDPSARLVARARRQPDSEFGGQISHASHAGAKVTGKGDNGACVACHGDPYTRAAPPEGHAVCAPCHAREAAPKMPTCAGCHQRGAARGSASRPRAAWSVAASFDHGDHAGDPRTPGQAPRCVECHAAIPRATRMEEITPPTMRSCDGCHDGKRAFKTTGFECKKCHGQPR